MKRLLAILSVLTALAVLLTNCSGEVSLPTKSDKRVAVEPDGPIITELYTLSRLREESLFGVVGRVVKHEEVYVVDSEYNHHFSHAVIRVEEVLFGDVAVGDKLRVHDTGGIHEDDYEITGWGDPLMRKGHRVMLFLSENTDHTNQEKLAPYVPTHNQLGKWFGDENGLFYPCMTFSKVRDRGFKHLSFVNNDPRTIEDVRKELSLDTPSS